MQTACVVVVPSIVPDCCPTVVLEAMAVGRPVVAAASGGIVDLVDDGVTGLLVPPGDPDALSTALSAVVDDRDTAAAMGREALARAGCSPHPRSSEGRVAVRTADVGPAAGGLNPTGLSRLDAYLGIDVGVDLSDSTSRPGDQRGARR